MFYVCDLQSLPWLLVTVFYVCGLQMSWLLFTVFHVCGLQMVSRPPFTVELSKGDGRMLSFQCVFIAPEELDQQDGPQDAEAIGECTLCVDFRFLNIFFMLI